MKHFKAVCFDHKPQNIVTNSPISCLKLARINALQTMYSPTERTKQPNRDQNNIKKAIATGHNG